MWQVTRDMWHVTRDTLYVTPDTWQVGGGEPSLKISAPYFLRFGIEGLMKIFSQIMTYWINEWVNDKGVYKTAPATPGLHITH